MNIYIADSDKDYTSFTANHRRNKKQKKNSIFLFQAKMILKIYIKQ